MAGRRRDGDGTAELRDFCARLSADPAFETAILPIGDGLLVATLRTDARRLTLRVRVRLFAMQREIAGTREVELDLPPEAIDRGRLDGARGTFPRLAPGRAAVRFARNGAYTDADTVLADGDEVAMIPPVSGGSDAAEAGAGAARVRVRILEIRAEPFGRGRSSPSSRRRVATLDDGAVVGFLGRHASVAGYACAGPGGRGGAARRPVRARPSPTRRSRPWPWP